MHFTSNFAKKKIGNAKWNKLQNCMRIMITLFISHDNSDATSVETMLENNIVGSFSEHPVITVGD